MLRSAKTRGERTAVICPEGSLSYRELADRTGALADALNRAGIGRGVQVALALPNSTAYLVWYFGVLEAGCIVVPLAPTTTPAEAEGLLGSSRIRHLVAQEGATLPRHLGIPRSEGFEAVEGACLWKGGHEERKIGTDPETPEGILTRQFSSGSTGRPKQMLKTEANIADDYRHFCDTLGVSDSDLFLAVAPLHHSYGAMSFLAPFFVGGCVLVLPRFLPAPVLEAARRHRPTVFMATPPMIEVLGSCALAPGDEDAFRSLRFCIVSTGHVRKAPCDAFEDRFGIQVRVQYGSTETLSAAIDLDDGFEEGRVGRPYRGVEIEIFDDDGNPCPNGKKGRIGIRSPAASERYEGDPGRTAETFRNAFVFPGDTGYLDGMGRLHVLGRSDIINIGGDKVDRAEVEGVIRRRLPVRDVIVLEGRRAGLPVVHAVVEADPAQVTRAMVVQVCREYLSSYKVPALVDVLEQLERDPTGTQ